MADLGCQRESLCVFSLLQQMQSCHKALHPLFKVRVSEYENHQTKNCLCRLQRTEMFQVCSISLINNNMPAINSWFCWSLKSLLQFFGKKPKQPTNLLQNDIKTIAYIDSTVGNSAYAYYK